MLRTLRHKGVAKKVLWFITVIIVLSFGFFGVANRMDNTVNSAGTMYGRGVSLKNFESAYLDARDAAIMLYGERFFKLGSRLDLEREAWDRLVILKEAQKRNIQASDKDVVEFIASVPFFQRDGKFDQSLYQMIVTNQSIFDRNVRDFEEGIRKQLTIRKLLDNVAGPMVLSDEDLKKEYQKRNEKITLNYVLFNAADYAKDLTASDEETKKFYAERKEQFRLPPAINLDYVQLTYPANASDQEKAKVKQEAMALAAQLNPQADFAAAAKKHNAIVKTSGFFTLDQPLLTFASAPETTEKLFAMKTGEYTKPAVEVPDGWQVIKIKEKKEAAVPAFEEISGKVKEALLLQKGFGVAKAKADETLKALTEIVKTKDFKTAASALGLKVEQTPSFGRKEYIAHMGLIREFQQEADQLNDGNKLSAVVATSQGPAILYLTAVEIPQQGQFEADKENFREMLTAERRNQTIVTFVTQLRLKADIKSKIKHK